MPTQQRMKRRIESTEDLQSVVGTMKALAAVNIRQYEKAAGSLDEFDRAVELGLRAVLRTFGSSAALPPQFSGQRVAVLIGSDQGMCGKFNEDVFRFAEEKLKQQGPAGGEWRVLVVGERVISLMHRSSWTVLQTFTVPSSASGITPLVQDILGVLGATENLATVLLLHNRQVKGSSYEPSAVRLLPLDRQWMESFRTRDWPTNQLPMFTMDRDELFLFLVRQYLFVSIYRAVAHSLAGENASRLAAMQAAESNIEERLGELTTAYHRERQSAITEELLDIVSGFEVLAG